MPNNNSLAIKLPYAQMGILVSPGGWWSGVLKSPSGYASDNGIFGLWKKNQEFQATPFLEHLDEMYRQELKPRWVLVPDAVGDSKTTNIRWRYWYQIIKYDFGFDLAFAVQNGHTKEDVPTSADVVFIGGSTEWKRKNIKYFCQNFPRVHVARINTLRWLWVCHNAGAESIDGTGWFRHPSRTKELIDYLDVASGKKSQLDGELFNAGLFASY